MTVSTRGIVAGLIVGLIASASAYAVQSISKLAVAPERLEFKKVIFGKTALTEYGSFKVKNAGSTALMATVGLPATSNFRVIQGLGTTEIEPKAFLAVTVEFAPNAPGTFYDSILVSSDATGGYPLKTVDLHGSAIGVKVSPTPTATGTPTPTVTVTPTATPTNVTTIDAPNRTDMVYDSQRQVLYITSGSQVLRYSTSSNLFLSPVSLGGTLIGLDLSPDQNVLAVADETVMSLDLVYLPTADSGDVTVVKLPISAGTDEVGLFDVAFGSDSMVYASGALPAGWSGWSWLRKIDPNTGNATIIGGEQVTNYTILRASGDRHVVGICQGDISDGRWGAIDVDTGAVDFRDWYVEGTSWYNYEMAVANGGQQFALPTYGGLFIYDDTYTKIYTLGQYATVFFDGVAYSPATGQLYATLDGSNAINIYDPVTFEQIGALYTGEVFPDNGNGEFSSGILRFSPDGSLLFVSVPGGIEYLKLF
ncbi:MAG TPA: hypothetical protein VMU16_14220 [Candidatus Binataceae bacterium]|nr:hypothetical protein [Candidatus Binataceae bacterium]